jgi:NADH-quinone oxidoreductase subunit N
MPAEIEVPSIAYGALSPLLIVFGAAVVGVLVESFASPARRRGLQIVTCVIGLLGALVAVVLVAGTHQLTIADAIAVDGPALFLQGTIAVLGLTGILLISEQSLDSSGGSVVASAATVPGTRDDVALAESTTVQTEVYPLALFSIGGMMLFPAANDLITLFIALEILSLPLYLMAGLARRRRLLSQEAAVKYFLLGAFSSAFFLYGVALLYGYAAGTRLGDIREAGAVAGGGNELLLYLGLGMLVVGLLFKVGAVPFQAWTPDVYQGAPTPVTALMAACTKVAAFGALLRVLYVAFGGTSWDWRPVLWAVAILTMVVGAVLAVTQTDVKRMLAYSSIAHTGFILVGVIALGERGLSSTLFYLLAYGFTTLASFAVVTLVRDASGEATHLARWAGLGRKSPLVAGTFAFLLFALAGIPLTSGFMAKFAVFTAGIEGGATALVIVGVVASAVTAFFYARVVVLMFFTDPPPDGPTVAVPSGYTAGAIALGLAVTVVLGVLPQPALDLAESAALFVR